MNENTKSPAGPCNLDSSSASLSPSFQPCCLATAQNQLCQTFHVSLPVNGGNFTEQYLDRELLVLDMSSASLCSSDEEQSFSGSLGLTPLFTSAMPLFTLEVVIRLTITPSSTWGF